MHALIVVSHPDPRSLTHAVARSFAEGTLHQNDRRDSHPAHIERSRRIGAIRILERARGGRLQ